MMTTFPFHFWYGNFSLELDVRSLPTGSVSPNPSHFFVNSFKVSPLKAPKQKLTLGSLPTRKEADLFVSLQWVNSPCILGISQTNTCIAQCGPTSSHWTSTSPSHCHIHIAHIPEEYKNTLASIQPRFNKSFSYVRWYQCTSLYLNRCSINCLSDQKIVWWGLCETLTKKWLFILVCNSLNISENSF